MNALLALSLLPAAFAIEDVRVEVGDGTVLERATVVVGDNGRILNVGPAVKVPAGAARIDGAGRVLTPGLIDLQSQLGLTEVLAELSTNDHAQTAPAAPTPGLRAADGINPLSPRLAITREEGVTTVVTSPRGVLLYGLGYALPLTGALSSRPDPKRPVAMYGGFTEYDVAQSGGSRTAALLRLREIFEDARFFAKGRAAYERGAARPLRLSPLHLEALGPVLAGKLPLVLNVHRASDVLALVAFAKAEGVRLVIAGGAEAWLVADALAAAKVPVVLQPSLQSPRTFETLHARDDAAALLWQAGVPLVLSAGEDGDQNQRRLRQEAGIAVAHGLSRAAALQAITSAPARALGLSDRGRVASGQRADLVLWSGDPLELSSVVEAVWIAGRPMPLETRQRALARRYLEAER